MHIAATKYLTRDVILINIHRDLRECVSKSTARANFEFSRFCQYFGFFFSEERCYSEHLELLELTKPC